MPDSHLRIISRLSQPAYLLRRDRLQLQYYTIIFISQKNHGHKFALGGRSIDIQNIIFLCTEYVKYCCILPHGGAHPCKIPQKTRNVWFFRPSLSNNRLVINMLFDLIISSQETGKFSMPGRERKMLSGIGKTCTLNLNELPKTIAQAYPLSTKFILWVDLSFGVA